MFQVYHSNQLSLLKDLLVALMQQSPLENPFDNETVLVQSPGMAQWLQLEIASSTGVAANIDFPLPASFIWQQFIHLLQDVPESSPFNKLSMTWHIMQLLPECLADPDFNALQHYLEQDDEGRKRFQLSEKIADIFDQYLVYRPEWIDRWDETDELDISAWHSEHPDAIPLWIDGQRWQAKLWKKLSQAIEKNFSAQGKAYHRAGLYKAFLKQLENSAQLHHLPKRIFVFGISALPESYLQALLGLSKHCDVHFLLSNPCRYYWGDIVDPKLLAKRFALSRQKLMVAEGKISELDETSWQKDEAHREWALSEDEQSEVGNPLLASMGKMGRDFLYQLYSLEQNEIDAFVDIERDNLLHHIQADILDLKDSSQALSLTASKRIVISDSDTSLSVHICHSIMREVEILHDNLLAMFSDDSTLTPKDIIVMVPNIDQYAPYVQAVFANQALRNSESNRYIPFTISDVSAQQENPILVSFLQLLKLNQSRYTREDILALLEVPAILHRFKLQQSDFVLLQKWINESGIRWGLNENSSTQWDLPKLSQNSWLFGLKRMLLGYAMGDELFEGISPYDDVQGLQGELLGRFIDFIDMLVRLEQSLKESYDAAQWQAFIYQLIDDFYLEDDDNSAIFTLIREQLDDLVSGTQTAHFSEPISLFVLLEYLQNHLTSQSSSQRFLAGQVNFCTLMPMRSIPFKVVCLLGMNDGIYPRNIVPMGFDLMAGHRKRGDRSRREEDRYLFLEALLSAQSQLYISYIGRDINDNSEKMASVLVSELLNYCQHSFVLSDNIDDESSQASEKLIASISHYYPMQSFSERYYHGNVKTFNPIWWHALHEEQVAQEDKLLLLPLAEPLIEVQLLHLKQFLKHPCKTFFNRRLDIFFELDNNELDNDEPFALDNLQQYHLKGQQFEVALEGRSLVDLFKEIKATGELPLSEFAPLAFNRDLQAMVDLADITIGYFVGEIETVNVDLQFGEKRLLGELTDHCENGLVRIKTGGIRGKEILSLWLEHLCYCITHGENLNSTLLGQGSGVFFEEVPADYAYLRLTELIELYELGLQQPLPFFIQSAFAWCTFVNLQQPNCYVLEDIDFETRAEAQQAALDIFANTRGFSEGSDPYISRVYDNLEDHWLEFEKIAFKVFKPILSNISAIEYSEGDA
ncbi:exodeoxyribonuclease V subunit gamma [Psychromonas sp. psych-6C06]|uniref:exodeoxyribonuclease V subunit gamma n=1 Tax=Psychromonas sp. psych-6C06 TaxID=2058089 RepID=UPI000C31D595|nr:exodeoxyribonuclease V subunit gamma [Psychromonas sp. psych-6C06]PKF63585.1 exodeoxyribonuclease V subunit gamma [Psychromonas sp. psych-6C06]